MDFGKVSSEPTVSGDAKRAPSEVSDTSKVLVTSSWGTCSPTAPRIVSALDGASAGRNPVPPISVPANVESPLSANELMFPPP